MVKKYFEGLYSSPVNSAVVAAAAGPLRVLLCGGNTDCTVSGVLSLRATREREESRPHKTKRWQPFPGPDSSEINRSGVCGWVSAVGRKCCSPLAVSRPASLRLQHRGRSLA